MRLNNLIAALLTSLFVFAMPLSAASSDELSPPSAGCVTYIEVINEVSLANIKEQNGTILEMEGVQASAFQSRVEELVGSKAPFKSDKVVVVNPYGDPDALVNIAFFAEGCLKAVLHLPAPVINSVSGPAVPLDEQGRLI